jgi:hypothetical protein
MLILTVLFLEGGLMDLGRVFRNLVAKVTGRSGAA